jgi:hypothetical protein
MTGAIYEEDKWLKKNLLLLWHTLWKVARINPCGLQANLHHQQCDYAQTN